MSGDANDPVPTEATMRAIVQDAYGSPDVFRLAQISTPEIGDSQVLVRVHAAGLDRGTWHLMAGQPYLLRLAFGFRKPKNPVPGLDLAGTVVAVGSAVTRFSPGEEVYGTGHGSFAGYAAAPEDQLARKPRNLSFEQAAVVPVSALTALQALADVGRIQSGQQVLIIGASGGVGSYAVQLAKALGAVVTGVSSTAKLDLVRSLGADHVIDYTREDFTQGGQRYDLAFELAGSHSPSDIRRVLTPKGTLVLIGHGESDGRWIGPFARLIRALVLSRFVSQRIASYTAKPNYSSGPNKGDLATLKELIEAGKITPVIDRTYSLSETPEAIRYLEEGHARGKVVITASEEGS